MGSHQNLRRGKQAEAVKALLPPEEQQVLTVFVGSVSAVISLTAFTMASMEGSKNSATWLLGRELD